MTESFMKNIASNRDEPVKPCDEKQLQVALSAIQGLSRIYERQLMTRYHPSREYNLSPIATP
jgi:hypothetical protein